MPFANRDKSPQELYTMTLPKDTSKCTMAAFGNFANKVFETNLN